MEPRYDFQSSESEIYENWEENNNFQADASSDKPPYVIAIPPPNVTGELHIGHALQQTLMDLLVRAHRMKGYEALFAPGADHAGIATQNVVEKQLREQNTTRHELGREEFIERVWEWKEEYGDRIVNQMKRLGIGCDWSRFRFTMDEDYARTVQDVFVKLYEKGLIYRGEYIVNWCVRCETSLSDLEVERKDVDGNLWYIDYPIQGEEDTITVATTRPETMLGDTAVAVHPNDERFASYHGKTAMLPIHNRPIPIVTDPFVDSSFGTGAVKVTPAHDENDYECARRNDLDVRQVIDHKGKMTADAGDQFEGMDRFECREEVVRELDQRGDLVRTEEYDLNQSLCDRCDTVLEPYLSKQWFVEMEPLAEPAVELAEEENLPEFIPERWQDVYLDWLRNTRDWCISRQLWWGHRIPVWWCEDCSEHTAAIDQPDSCPECGSTELTQETDVLDTWFSSALWPFAIFGWPEQTEDLEKFFPTDTLVTGRDIIYLWVARMVFTSLEFLDQEPFEDVFINPNVQTEDGKRMSKSLGTGIDPMNLVEQVGADATRFGLTLMTTGQQDIRFSPDKIEESRNLVTKIWNAFRLILESMDSEESLPSFKKYDSGNNRKEDEWILSRHHRCRAEMNKALDEYDFSEYCQQFYHHFWNDFCDWYLEWVKPRLNSDNAKERRNVHAIVNELLQGMLKLIHPAMPFVTEELWTKLRSAQENPDRLSETIMEAGYPKGNETIQNQNVEDEMETVQQIISGVREIRSRMNISPNQVLSCSLSFERNEQIEKLDEYSNLIKDGANLDDLELSVDLEKPSRSAAFVEETFEGYVPLEDVIDVEKEIDRLEKQLKETEEELEHVNQKLANNDFVKKAPDDVVQGQRDRKESLLNEREKLRQNLEDWKE